MGESDPGTFLHNHFNGFGQRSRSVGNNTKSSRLIERPCVFMFERIYSQHSGTRLNFGFFYNSEFRFSAAMLMSCQCLSWVLLREISIQYDHGKRVGKHYQAMREVETG